MDTYAQKIRRQLHMYPEIGFALPKTLGLLKEELDRMGVDYREDYGKSSLVATINPEKSQYTIGIRADMDALPIQECRETEYRSRIDGCMHACGHDAHTAIALAALRALNGMKEQLDCRVKFLFQSAEEYSTLGAKLMVEDGVMEDIDCIVALHCDPNFDAGQVAVTAGGQGSVSVGFRVDTYGQSAHAANQQEGVDAIMMAVQLYTAIEFMIAKQFPARTPLIFNVGAIHGGETNNVICEHCSMFCTLRAWEEGLAKEAEYRIRRLLEAFAGANGGRAVYTPVKYYPAVYNDEALSAKVREAARKVLGPENVLINQRYMSSEDFSYFARCKPGCMFRLGIRNRSAGIDSGLHEADFDIDEACLEVGKDILVQFVLDNGKRS